MYTTVLQRLWFLDRRSVGSQNKGTVHELTSQSTIMWHYIHKKWDSMFSSEIVTSYLYVRLLRNMNSIICYLLNIASSVFCYMFASSLFFFSFYIFLLHIYMVELHFKFLLNFSVSCCFSVEAGSSGSLFVQSWIFFFPSVMLMYSSSS